MKIASVNNQLIKDTVKLHQRKHRNKQNLFVMEGYHLYEEAKKQGIIRTIFTTDESIQGDNVIYVTRPVLEKLSQMKSPQGVFVVCEKVKKQMVESRVLLLERVQDPGNLGTLLRSALAFGFETVVLDNCVDLYNDKVIRSTQGNFFDLNIIEMTIQDFIEDFSHYHVYGTAMEGKPIQSISKNNDIAVLLGNEGQGVSKESLTLVDETITIKTNIESLNVAVAGSIIMHHINEL